MTFKQFLAEQDSSDADSNKTDGVEDKDRLLFKKKKDVEDENLKEGTQAKEGPQGGQDTFDHPEEDGTQSKAGWKNRQKVGKESSAGGESETAEKLPGKWKPAKAFDANTKYHK